MLIVGVDPSLTSTGLAQVDTDMGEWFTKRIRTAAPKAGPDRLYAQAARMGRIALDVAEAALNWQGSTADLVVIEGLSMASHGNATRDLAGLWWSIVQRLTIGAAMEGIELLVIAPATRAKYATGSGRASKSDVLAAVRATYSAADVPGHDIADAVALAALGARVKGFPVEGVEPHWVQEVAASVAAREAEKGK